MSRFILMAALISFLSLFYEAQAADQASAHVHGSHTECPLPKSTQDILRCAQEEHPRVQRAKLSLNQTRGLSDQVSQFQNPELEVESVSGSIEGEKRSESKIALLVPIELGGKRSARKFEAQSQTKHSEAELLEVQSEVIIETVTKLHRLRQLEKEKSLLLDGINNFTQVVNQQKSRPGLAPEQKVSLSVFRMALAEAKIRQAELFEEEKALEHYFHISTGHSLSEIKPYLPKAPQDWPTISTKPENALSPRALASRAELDLALAQVHAAQANTWPELKVGPMFQQEQEGSNRGSIFGVQLSMGLPVFSLNSGSKNYAKLGETKAQKILILNQSEENHEREEQVRVYERTVQILKETPSTEELEKDLKQNENYSKRGLVSASLIIESHRQIEELARSRHGREIKAFESLWHIHKFDGRILMESL
jgi:cobalt-zinc-cadmium efflux system outer membrane protein